MRLILTRCSHLDAVQGHARLHSGAIGDQQLVDYAAHRRRDGHRGLVRLNLTHHLILFDGVAGGLLKPHIALCDRLGEGRRWHHLDLVTEHRRGAN